MSSCIHGSAVYMWPGGLAQGVLAEFSPVRSVECSLALSSVPCPPGGVGRVRGVIHQPQARSLGRPVGRQLLESLPFSWVKGNAKIDRHSYWVQCCLYCISPLSLQSCRLGSGDSYSPRTVVMSLQCWKFHTEERTETSPCQEQYISYTVRTTHTIPASSWWRCIRGEARSHSRQESQTRDLAWPASRAHGSAPDPPQARSPEWGL